MLIIAGCPEGISIWADLRVIGIYVGMDVK